MVIKLMWRSSEASTAEAQLSACRIKSRHKKSGKPRNLVWKKLSTDWLANGVLEGRGILENRFSRTSRKCFMRVAVSTSNFHGERFERRDETRRVPSARGCKTAYFPFSGQRTCRGRAARRVMTGNCPNPLAPLGQVEPNTTSSCSHSVQQSRVATG